MQNNGGNRDEVARIHEPGKSTDSEVEYRVGLESYFDNSVGSKVEKLQSFAKFVPRQNLTNFISKYEIFKQILPVQGSIIECGVYLGGGLMTFAQLSAIMEPVNLQRRIIGFDTFSGFPSVAPEDGEGLSSHAKVGGFSVNGDVHADLLECIKLYDSNRFIGHYPKVSLVKGDIMETMPKFIEENPHTVVSLLYLDLDIFEPTKVAIETLLPRMPKGAILAFDELNSERWPGETLAVLETVGISNLRIQRPPFDSLMSYAVIE
jgi:hypothetical protein